MFLSTIGLFILIELLSISTTLARGATDVAAHRPHHRRHIDKRATSRKLVSSRTPSNTHLNQRTEHTETHYSPDHHSWWSITSWTTSTSRNGPQSGNPITQYQPWKPHPHPSSGYGPPANSHPSSGYGHPGHSHPNPSPAPGSVEHRWLVSHNQVRSKYGAQPLTWDNKLAQAARACTQTCVWQHTQNNEFGENIAAGQMNIESVVSDWVNGPTEKGAYDPNHPVDSHYTQVVWKASARLGCALTVCQQIDGSGLPQPSPPFWACEYDPPGNVEGEYTQNVDAYKGGAPDV